MFWFTLQVFFVLFHAVGYTCIQVQVYVLLSNLYHIEVLTFMSLEIIKMSVLVSLSCCFRKGPLLQKDDSDSSQGLCALLSTVGPCGSWQHNQFSEISTKLGKTSDKSTVKALNNSSTTSLLLLKIILFPLSTDQFSEIKEITVNVNFIWVLTSAGSQWEHRLHTSCLITQH